MTPSSRILRWHYIVAAAFTGHCAATTANAGSAWYAAGMFTVSLLLLVALAREYIAADERRASAVRAERAARLRAQRDDVTLGWRDLESACCLRAWESHGAEHDTTHCTRKDQAA
ncbi:hypothetical protein ACFWR9_20770 [Streptomyces sp. NPDC058534]|uniref:hypothetical protein n=1 Tax=Streptomyces sp. NPDC058534 TaxID=3346541 RepID=UPI00365AEE9D